MLTEYEREMISIIKNGVLPALWDIAGSLRKLSGKSDDPDITDKHTPDVREMNEEDF